MADEREADANRALNDQEDPVKRAKKVNTNP